MNRALMLWDLAMSDLKSAEILFEKKQYRTSIFLFQQASEKACKSFILSQGGNDEEFLRKKFGHRIEKKFNSDILNSGDIVTNI
ncbi:HEPN domain-containing protein [Pedobacter sp. UBA4863]|uniref:HEPN domain-containing protein n=1 Tax=Pedobacter sp. UBA4863 TaxID=1947060 RepID=UPI0025F08C7A|nr:HEPN domain-containing protein [Pedobacter sp. UBA4863]